MNPNASTIATKQQSSTVSVYCLCHKSGQINVIAHKFYLLCTFDDLWLTVLYLGEVRSRDSTHTLCRLRLRTRSGQDPGTDFLYTKNIFLKNTNIFHVI